MKPCSLYLRRDAIDSLAANPFTRGDFQEKDETGRDVEIKITGSYAIAFWVNHAVQEVKIVDIIPADVG